MFLLLFAFLRAMGKHTITMGEISSSGAQVTKDVSTFFLSDYS